MAYIVIMGDELYHHGIKGMKWGVRRFQNADGSLKQAGRKRQTDGGEKKQPTDEEKATRNAKIKKAAVIGASVTAACLAAYGGYKLKQRIEYEKTAKDLVSKYAKKSAESYAKSMTRNIPGVREYSESDRKKYYESYLEERRQKHADAVKKLVSDKYKSDKEYRKKTLAYVKKRYDITNPYRRTYSKPVRSSDPFKLYRGAL